ncbi:carbon-nitrogen hydrolase [Lentzea tibetensis]|uniref:Carbon-nitrogen hydrolase n=1 Tax=Lentzea tibetensis TaxID=2591470 RepID=A0A563F1A9_9PSEU|nr:nitrilase-related carbon-nitrogen hydrolase [Lentzea tibetensis]TWP53750.1 carbon-nitrogen hydrolase [Lentzea tibetensis]
MEHTTDPSRGRLGAPIRVLTKLSPQVPAAGTGLRLALFQGEGQAGAESAKKANLDRAADAVERAADFGAHLVVLPEMWTTGYSLDDGVIRALAEPADGPSVEEGRRIAREAGTGLVLPFPELDPATARVYNAAAVIGADGTLLHVHRKTHLYGQFERDEFSASDDLPGIVEINGIRVGTLICYETEFPPLYQHFAEQGAQVVVGPTAADGTYRLADDRMSHIPYPDITRHQIPAMACFWGLFVAYANRRGWERPARCTYDFLGNSGIWGPDGEAMVAVTGADKMVDSLLIADCVPATHPRFSPEGDRVRDNRFRLAATMSPAV